MAAPILSLAEGERTITLLAHLGVPASAPVVAQVIGYALDVTLTGAEGWLPADSVQASLLADDGSGKPALSLTVTLGAAAAAVVAFDPALHGPGPSIGRPLLRCLIKGDTGIYEVLDGLVVEKVDLSVDVKGVRNLVVQNADGPLNASQAMPLFGSQPQIGAPFYIGSAEVFGKRLTSLDAAPRMESAAGGSPRSLWRVFRYRRQPTLSKFPELVHAPTSTCSTTARSDACCSPVRCSRRSRPIRGRSRPTPARSARRSPARSIWSSRIWNSRTPSLRGSSFGFVRLVLEQPHTRRSRRERHHGAVRGVRSQRVPAPVRESGDCAQPVAGSADSETAPAERAVHAGAQESVCSTTPPRRSLVPGDIHSAGTFLIVGPFGATRAGERGGRARCAADRRAGGAVPRHRAPAAAGEHLAVLPDRRRHRQLGGGAESRRYGVELSRRWGFVARR